MRPLGRRREETELASGAAAPESCDYALRACSPSVCSLDETQLLLQLGKHSLRERILHRRHSLYLLMLF
ncbi:hypothetical protein CgunFtcFv8_024162 [Champsocephalus gunnari]|uniref:Uncharacterized protein n=1 Tax=Champsocephalus gunnari TaxID=52237 RepID=A0AAN8DCV2_CHAGU|nr:hypothetical protein CgunFtcFv8_024162 [Champsocephalus gunnari]